MCAKSPRLSPIRPWPTLIPNRSLLPPLLSVLIRALSDRYAQTVAEVLAGNGIHVWLTGGDTPTPMVSYAVVEKGLQGGVMITASHNPPRYNGIKLKAAYGGSASPADAKEIERRIRKTMRLANSPATCPDVAIEQGLITRFDPLPAYRTHLHRLVDFDCIRNASLSVAVDAMYGAGRSIYVISYVRPVAR